MCHHAVVWRSLTTLLGGMLTLSAAACGAAGTDASLQTIQGGAAAAPVVAVIETTTTTTTAPPPPPPAPVVERQVSPSAAVTPRAPRPVANLVALGRLIIPRLGLDTIFYEGDTLDVIDHGPGHMPYTPLPGKIGNAVIAGHRVTHSKPFRNLDTLQVGDTATFVMPSGQYTYSFTGHEIVTPDRIDITNQSLAYTATLFACHPPGSARYRIVARWKLTSAPEAGQPDPATLPPS